MHIKPKKSLGQNFLIDKNIRNKIINACGLRSKDRVLEIGAGRGELSGLILEKVARLYAVELDSRLTLDLRENFKNHSNIEIINQDILQFNLLKIRGKAIVVGNIPYYITSPIIEHLLKFKQKIKVIFLTVQKEFAARIAAKPGTKTYGSFSCFVQYNAECKVLFNIKKGSFSPQPRVDSAFIKMQIRNRPPVEVKNETDFFKIIRASFNQRRKTLRNSLEGILPKEALILFFNKYAINYNIRPEDLSLRDFANLANMI